MSHGEGRVRGAGEGDGALRAEALSAGGRAGGGGVRRAGEGAGRAAATSAGGRAPTAVLLGATLVWGSTFIVTKDVLADMSAWGLLVWRFGLAAIVLLVLAGVRLRTVDRAHVGHGVVIGILLGLGFGAQTLGLTRTSAATNGFITGLMVVLAPLVARAAFGRRFDRHAWLGVGLATAGLAVLSWQGGGSDSTAGVVLSLVGAALFAGQIACLSQWAAGADALALTAIQVTTAFGVTAIAAAATNSLTPPRTTAGWVSIVYLAVGATVIGLVGQAWAQGRMTAARAAVILTMEPVFAGLFAVLGGEALTARLIVGGSMIVAAMLVVEFAARPPAAVGPPRPDRAAAAERGEAGEAGAGWEPK